MQQTLKIMKQTLGKPQRGMTLIGMLLIVIVIGFMAVIAMKVIPMYMQFFTVKSTVESLRSENIGQMGTEDIYKALQKRFDTGYVEGINPRDFKIRNERTGKVMDMVYKDERELFYGLYVVLKHNETIPLNK